MRRPASNYFSPITDYDNIADCLSIVNSRSITNGVDCHLV